MSIAYISIGKSNYTTTKGSPSSYLFEEVLRLSLVDNYNKFKLLSVEGLDPTDFSMVLVSAAGSDNKLYNIVSNNRSFNVVISATPDLSKNETVSDLRNYIYSLTSYSLRPEFEIRLIDEDDHILGFLMGFLEDTSVDTASDVLTASLSFVCDDGIISARRYLGVSGVVDKNEKIYLNNILGTAPGAVRLLIKATIADTGSSDSSVLTINHGTNFISASLSLTMRLKDTYLLNISTDSYNRYIKSGPNTNGLKPIAHLIRPNSIFPIGFPGINWVSFNYTSATSKIEVIEYSCALNHWGV
jgi:hypothetical protein